MNSPVKIGCIIDDDNTYVNLMSTLIKMKKLSEKLLVFNNGQEAIDYFEDTLQRGAKDELPQVIFLDLNMPIMNGWQFLEQFDSESCSGCSLYVVSSSINPSDIDRAKRYPTVTDYITKPMEITTLEEVFASAS
ncbi:response regulator [Spongiivirga citrea]|uniref:Response regulator n=1 Tax=Spongiivirga citrea TaxID=1481457 RepID=A0A6M0CJB6_9FLAO|nr:response regulator [Spongiivirga citrea]NER17931.1 response regulator [Spongiivirga citrea]